VVAPGPLIGGWFTTNLSWRWVFAGETIAVIGILLTRGQIAQAPAAEHRPRLDIVGSVLSAAALGLIVFGILMSSTWGLIEPRSAPTINGTEITPLGFSVVPFLILGGLAVLGGFVIWEDRRHRLGLDRLVDTALLRIEQLRAGLLTLLGQQLVLMGTFFVVPVYLQVVLGFDAFETGKRLVPMSAAMLVFALLGPRIAGRRSPRTVSQMGLLSISAGAIVMLATLDVHLNDTGFKIALVLIGAGAGLLASQLGNVIMSSVDPSKTSETGGLQGTALNLGASLGTALIGAVLIVGLINGFNDGITDNPQLPASVEQTITANTEEGIDIVPVSDVQKSASDAGLPEDQATAVASAYGDAQLDALRKSLGAVAALALLSLWFTRRLPGAALTPAQAAAAAGAD
jgi:MFS family permease